MTAIEILFKIADRLEEVGKKAHLMQPDEMEECKVLLTTLLEIESTNIRKCAVALFVAKELGK